MNPVYEKLQSCLASVREKTDFIPRVALILASVWVITQKKLKFGKLYLMRKSRDFRFLRCLDTRAGLSLAI